MESKAVRKFKWFWPWQDEKEEAWLQKMSLQGLHLRSASRAGFYTFSSGAPQEFIYLTGYCGPSNKDKDGFIKSFQIAGWEYVTDSYWNYFRSPAQPGQTPPTQISIESKVKKYRGRMGYYLVAMLSLILIPEEIARRSASLAGDLFQLVCYVLFLLSLYIIFKIRRRIQQLNYAEYQSKDQP